MVKNTSGKLWARKNAGKLIKEHCLVREMSLIVRKLDDCFQKQILSCLIWHDIFANGNTLTLTSKNTHPDPGASKLWWHRWTYASSIHHDKQKSSCSHKIRQGTQETTGIPKINVLLAWGLAAIKPPYGRQNQTTGTHCLRKRVQWNHNIMFD